MNPLSVDLGRFVTLDAAFAAQRMNQEFHDVPVPLFLVSFHLPGLQRSEGSSLNVSISSLDGIRHCYDFPLTAQIDFTGNSEIDDLGKGAG